MKHGARFQACPDRPAPGADNPAFSECYATRPGAAGAPRRAARRAPTDRLGRGRCRLPRGGRRARRDGGPERRTGSGDPRAGRELRAGRPRSWRARRRRRRLQHGAPPRVVGRKKARPGALGHRAPHTATSLASPRHRAAFGRLRSGHRPRARRGARRRGRAATKAGAGSSEPPGHRRRRAFYTDDAADPRRASAGMGRGTDRCGAGTALRRGPLPKPGHERSTDRGVP